MHPAEDRLAEIARKAGFETLATRKSDSLDFHEVAVWAMREALVAAYDQGVASREAEVAELRRACATALDFLRMNWRPAGESGPGRHAEEVVYRNLVALLEEALKENT
jgi:hypothetical protein